MNQTKQSKNFIRKLGDQFVQKPPKQSQNLPTYSLQSFVRQNYFKIMQNQDYKRFLACILWLVGCSCFVLSFMYANINHVSPQITLLWKAVSQFTLTFIIVRFSKDGQLDMPYRRSFWFCTLRGFIIGIYMLIFALCQFYLPLPIVHTLNSTIPIFTSIFDFFLHKISFTRKQIFGLVGAFIGIATIIVTSQQYDKQNTQFEHYHPVNQSILLGLQLLLILNAAMISYAFVITKELKDINGHAILNNHAIIYAILAGVLYHIDFSGIFSEGHSTVARIQWEIAIKGIFFSGFITSFGTCLQIIALKLSVSSGKVVMMEYITVVMAYIISILFYSEPLNFLSLFGVILALFCIYLTIR